MKKVAFVTSHLGSDSGELVRILNENPRIVMYSSGNTYDSVNSLEWLFEQGHKFNNASAIYGDHLLFNPQLGTKSLYKIAQFIYVVRPARPSLQLIYRFGTNPLQAMRHYCYRLRRICELAKRTPNALLITWQELSSGEAFGKIEKFLHLKEKLKTTHESFCEQEDREVEFLEEAQDSYERHLYFLKNLEHLQ